MRWTKSTPKEPGLYWYSLRLGDDPNEGTLRHTKVFRVGPRLLAAGADCPVDIKQFRRWWCGPLPYPPGSPDAPRKKVKKPNNLTTSPRIT